MNRDPFERRVLERCLAIVNDSELRPLLEQAADSDTGNTMTRMLCGRISQELFSKVENTAAMLHISKREFIELAVSTAVARAEAIAEQEGVYESFQLAHDANQGRAAA